MCVHACLCVCMYGSVWYVSLCGVFLCVFAVSLCVSYVYVCVYVRTCLCMCMSVCECVCVWCQRMCVYTFVSVCWYVCVCVDVCMCVCMSVDTHVMARGQLHWGGQCWFFLSTEGVLGIELRSQLVSFYLLCHLAGLSSPLKNQLSVYINCAEQWLSLDSFTHSYNVF